MHCLWDAVRKDEELEREETRLRRAFLLFVLKGRVQKVEGTCTR